MDSYTDSDPFIHSRMPFWQHIEELRAHLWRAIWGFAIAFVLSFLVAEPLLRVLAQPVEDQLGRYWDGHIDRYAKSLTDNKPPVPKHCIPAEVEMIFDRQELAPAVGGVPGSQEGPVRLKVQIDPARFAVVLAKPMRDLIHPSQLSTLGVTEAFVIYFKVAMWCGVVLASPWIFYQLWSFVATGLYPHEKRSIHYYLPCSIVLFLAGVVLCELAVIPVTVEYLLSFNEWLGLEPSLRLSDWLSFALMLPVIFGLCFQLPLVMLFLNRLGIVESDTYRAKRKHALFLTAIAAAVLTPTPDALTLCLLMVPLFFLYELGIWLCRGFGSSALEDMEPAESVEV